MTNLIMLCCACIFGFKYFYALYPPYVNKWKFYYRSNYYQIGLILKMALLTKVLFSGVCIAVLLYGILDVISNYEQNKCHMTYMFEQPEYLVSLVFLVIIKLYKHQQSKFWKCNEAGLQTPTLLAFFYIQGKN